MNKIVLASNNAGKVSELDLLLHDAGFSVVAQNAFSVPDAEETGLTFIENAILKARHASKLTGLPAIADDSGLVVHALNGEPGIYSARYAGEQRNDKKNNQALLAALDGVADQERTAYFYCALAYIRHENDPTPIICLGQLDGFILHKPQGVQGFGYDPLFFIPSLGRSCAELTKMEKNNISHRGQALKQLIATLSHKNQSV